MTAQYLFDEVCRHLITQNRQSSVIFEGTNCRSCMYRRPDGCKCAIGGILTDDEYRPFMEYKLSSGTFGMAVEDLGDARLLPARLIPHTVLLSHLQRAHDNSQTGYGLLTALKKIANDQNLSASVLDGAEFRSVWAEPFTTLPRIPVKWVEDNLGVKFVSKH